MVDPPPWWGVYGAGVLVTGPPREKGVAVGGTDEVGGTAVGGTAVGGTEVGGTAVGGTAVGGMGVWVAVGALGAVVLVASGAVVATFGTFKACPTRI